MNRPHETSHALSRKSQNMMCVPSTVVLWRYGTDNGTHDLDMITEHPRVIGDSHRPQVANLWTRAGHLPSLKHIRSRCLMALLMALTAFHPG